MKKLIFIFLLGLIPFLSEAQIDGIEVNIPLPTVSTPTLTLSTSSNYRTIGISVSNSVVFDVKPDSVFIGGLGKPTSYLLDRTNHTGFQAISTITGLQTAIDAKEVLLTFGSGLTRTTNTITANLITGLAGGQTIIGGTASGENLILKSTSNATLGLTEFDGTTGLVWDGTNKWLGIGITPTTELQIQKTSSTGIQALIRNQGTGSSSIYLRVAGGANTTDPYIIFQSDSFYSLGIDQSDGSKFKIRNASALSTAASAIVIDHGSQNIGIRVSAPTAALHLPAGVASAGLAPFKITTGTLLTTAEAGAMEYNNNWYQTKASGLRYVLGGCIFDAYTDANNSGTAETDLYSYTTPASTLAVDGSKLKGQFSGKFADLTATTQLKVYFAGTVIANTGTLTVSTLGAWDVTFTVVRTSSTTARAIVSISTPGTSTTSTITETDLTGLTLSNTNILKITGTAAGATGGDNDIVAKIGTINWIGVANN